MRALAAALTAAGMLAAAGPAAAASPPPTVLDFEDQPVGTTVNEVYDGSDVAFSDADSCGDVLGAGGKFGPRHLGGACPAVRVLFRDRQAAVSLYAQVGAAGPSGTPVTLDAQALDATGGVLAERRLTPTPDTWTPLVLATGDGTATIASISVDTTRFTVGVDDIAYSPVPQPDTEITVGPSGTVAGGDGSFTFAANQTTSVFTCSLDGAPSSPCRSPFAFTGLADGTHSFSVAATDRWGATDATPAVRSWTVSRPVPPPDGDADGVPDASDNCPASANAEQADADGDGLGDACEVLPSGTIKPVAGVTTEARLVSGEVFVKLPPGASRVFTAGLHVPFQDGGFLPLKGVASIPVGSVVDASRGALALQAAVNGRSAADRRQIRRTATLRAGIFAIRQKRAKRSTKKRFPPSVVLVSAAGAERPCQQAGPAKGVRVRSVTTTAKGVFRTVGAAATAAPAKGSTPTFVTTDRCDGTLTEVGRGRVAVISKKTGRRTTVRSGRGYLVKARLFRAKKGRRDG